MKKASILLICVTALFAIFLCGFIVGRNFNRSPIAVSSDTTISHPSTESTATIPSSELLNINTATLAQLSELPGIGEVIAQRIIDYRETNGPFQSINQLSDIEGIGDKRLTNLREYITVGD